MRYCVFVIGTRAQLVKIAPVLKLAVDTGLRHTVWFTGQHSESIEDLIEDFELESSFEMPRKPIERSSISKLFIWIPGTLNRCYRYIHSIKTWSIKAPLVVVHGDTLSTWLGAVAGKWGGGEIVHLESGLSSGNRLDPFPEEMLRRLTFRKARYALCPNDEAAARMEKYSGCIVVNTGENTLLDCVRHALAHGNVASTDNADFVVSVHRFQNIYRRESLEQIVDEMIDLAEHGSVWFILHPPTEIRLRKYGLFDRLQSAPGIQLHGRMPYTRFLELMSRARAVFSDGGSNQEELSYLGVPTVLYRERSERPDGLGRNIVLRSQLDAPPAACIANGKIDDLRKESRMNDAVQPSLEAVNALLRWAGAKSSGVPV